MPFNCKDGTPETGSHWDWMEEGKPIIGVDFHHTISTKCGACPDGEYGGLSAGNPQEGVKEALDELHKTFKIIIYTGYGLVAAEKNGNPHQEVKDYLNKYNIPFDDVACKPYPFAFMVDDRAIHHTSWERTLSQIQERSSLSTEDQTSLRSADT